MSCRKRKALLLLAAALTVVALFFVWPVGEGLQARAGELSDNLAVVLVIDVSGSMERTDPERLRETASRMFIDLLGVEDYLGLIVFDQQPELVAPLQPLGDAARKDELMEKLSPRLDPGGSTDFLSALEAARGQFEETDLGGRRPVVLLLTDGEPNPDPARRDDTAFMDAYMESLWEVTGALAWERIPIYAIGFSDEIDIEVLRRFSRDTGGEYSVLEEPAGLLVAFFEVLADLKGRMSLLEETFELQDTSRSFTFPVDEYTRQVNLVAVNTAGVGNLSLDLHPPRGEGGAVPELSISGRDNYVLAILSQPGQEHHGLWELTVSGSGRVELMANADLYLEATLLEPAPSSQHPLHEPMDFIVELSAREDFAGLPFQVEMHVTAPEDVRPTVVPLTLEEGRYRGTYDPVDRQGEYRLQLQVLLEGEPVYSSSTRITVKLLPVLTTDFWAAPEGYRLGEEMIVSASLLAGGNRLTEGSHLQLDSFTLFLDYEDGRREGLDLFDDGDPEHVNVRAGDGIWSNRLVFEREGRARATLITAGVYRETDFRLEKSLGEIFTGAAGAIAVAPAPGELTAAPGRRLLIPLLVENRSPFPETLVFERLEAPVPGVATTRQEFTLKPGEAAEITLAVDLGRGLEPGPHRLTLAFSAAHPLTAVEPSSLEQPLVLQTLWQRALHGVFGSVNILWPILAAALLLYGGGLLCFYLLAAPQMKLGLLTCRKVDDREGVPRKIRLGRVRKPKVVVSFDPASKAADFTIEGSDFFHDLVFSTEKLTRMPRFLLGWRSLFGGVKEAWYRKKVECTPPGVIEVRGAAYTWKELDDGDDEFISGSYFFRYYDAASRYAKKPDRGVNLLEGKM